MRRTALLIIIMLIPLDGFAQEEHHKQQHRHTEYAMIKNPIAKTETSIVQGRKLYEKNCIACHGEAGKGGIGPGLSVPARIHGSTDGEMFHVITDGVAGTAMRGFGKELSDEMRWHLVNYVTSLQKKK
ncbi:MAG: c-type cytochrome [Nitrospirae bacterium]|nr:c-type cytochrome [Nitrospirota bacterium]